MLLTIFDFHIHKKISFDLQYDAQGTGTIDLTEFLSLIANRDKGFLNNEVSNFLEKIGDK